MVEGRMAKEGEVTRVIRRARQVLDEGRYDEALRDLLHLGEKYPDAGEIRPAIAQVLLMRGKSRLGKGKIREARIDVEKSLDWAILPDAYVQLGRMWMEEGDLDHAHEYLNRAIECDDSFGPAHEQLGFLLLRWSEFGEAARAFEHALSLNHATPELFLAVWNAYMSVDRLDRAHELLLDGVERFPQNDRLYSAAGDSFVYAKGDSNAAEPYWRKAIELNPRNLGATFSLAGLAATRGLRRETLDLLRRCLELDRETTVKRWREDLATPLPRFREFARDPEFRKHLGE
jgi:tetratricopeptide (TPR) repeat protein